MAAQRDQAVVEIDGPAGLGSIGAIHARLVAAMSSAAQVTLDLSKAGEFDLTFIQLVESARRYATAHTVAFSLSPGANSALSQQLTRGGFLTRAEDRAFWGAEA